MVFVFVFVFVFRLDNSTWALRAVSATVPTRDYPHLLVALVATVATVATVAYFRYLRKPSWRGLPFKDLVQGALTTR